MKTKYNIKRLGSISLGIFGVFIFIYGALGLIKGSMYVPAKYGTGFTAIGLEAYIIALIPILFGSSLSLYLMHHNGYIFNSKKIFKLNRLLLKIAISYTVVYLALRSIMFFINQVNI